MTFFDPRTGEFADSVQARVRSKLMVNFGNPYKEKRADSLIPEMYLSQTPSMQKGGFGSVAGSPRTPPGSPPHDSFDSVEEGEAIFVLKSPSRKSPMREDPEEPPPPAKRHRSESEDTIESSVGTMDPDSKPRAPPPPPPTKPPSSASSKAGAPRQPPPPPRPKSSAPPPPKSSVPPPPPPPKKAPPPPPKSAAVRPPSNKEAPPKPPPPAVAPKPPKLARDDSARLLAPTEPKLTVAPLPLSAAPGEHLLNIAMAESEPTAPLIETSEPSVSPTSAASEAQVPTPLPPSKPTNGAETESTAQPIPEAQPEPLPAVLDLETPDVKPAVDLPPGWMCVWSKSQKRWYFFDTKTNKSVWTWPP